MRRLLAILGAVFCLAAASDPAERLPDPGQEARARAIFAQVRCLVCQNESIDDSQAELAGDLRRLVRDQIAAGKSDDQVKTYLTDRYGEFVLLKPAFSWGTRSSGGAVPGGDPGRPAVAEEPSHAPPVRRTVGGRGLSPGRPRGQGADVTRLRPILVALLRAA